MTRKQAPKWTAADIASIRADMADGKRDYEIAKRIGMLQSTFGARLAAAGIVRDAPALPESMRRGAAVLTEHYETMMATADVFTLYAAARKMAVTIKMMHSQAHKLRLNRPKSLRTTPPEAHAVLAVIRKRRREAIAAAIIPRLAAGEAMSALRASLGFGGAMIRAMKREGLLENRIYRARTAKPKVKAAPKPKPTPEPKPVRVVKVPPVIIPEPPRAPAPLPAPVNGKIYANFRQIRAWAEDRGFCYDGSNMDQVNRRRAAMGLPVMVQDEGVGA